MTINELKEVLDEEVERGYGTNSVYLINEEVKEPEDIKPFELWEIKATDEGVCLFIRSVSE